MRIGFDMDGVLAAFVPAYEELIVRFAGEDKFPARYPAALPPVWDWPQHYGYDTAVIDRVWKHIKYSTTFWRSLPAVPGAWTLMEYLRPRRHELYFVTDRPGVNPQGQTVRWLTDVLNVDRPSVITSRRGKGIVAKALALDIYVDDKYENVLDAQEQSPETKVLCIDYPYNQGLGVQTRLRSPADVMEYL